MKNYTRQLDDASELVKSPTLQDGNTDQNEDLFPYFGQ